MKKIRTRKLVTIIILTVILSTTIFSFGSSINQTIDVVYNNIKLVVDGNPVDFGLDSSGNEIEPFIYNGTTYLPVRAVGETLGKTVDWDGETKTVYLGKKNINDDAATYINNGIDYMNYQEGNTDNGFNSAFSSETTVTDNIGNSYNNYLMLYIASGFSYSDAWNYVEYPTNGEYSKFKATLALDENYKNTTAEFKVQVYADDELVYNETYKAGFIPKELDIDINNALKVKIRTKKIEGGYYKIGFMNPRFIE